MARPRHDLASHALDLYLSVSTLGDQLSSFEGGYNRLDAGPKNVWTLYAK